MKRIGFLLLALACRGEEPVPAPSPAPPPVAVATPIPEVPTPAPVPTPEPPPPADSILADVERSYRSIPRAVRMDVATTRVQTEPIAGLPPHEELLLWGVVNGDPEKTSVLYGFYEPSRYRGTGLLIEDERKSVDGDTMWYHMRTFRRFQNIPSTSLRLLVAGTCMTYEDARGFLATDRYEFRATDDPDVIVARPLTPELESDTGYSQAEVRIDPQKRYVTEIRFTDLGGRPWKVYSAGEPVRIKGSWFPGKARIEDLQGAVVSTVKYRYIPLESNPPASLYDTDVDDQLLLDRLTDALARLGIVAEEPASQIKGPEIP